MNNEFHEKAESIRDVIRYLKRFKDASVFVHIQDSVIESPLFSNHIRDIALIHEAGLKIGIIPGAQKQIDDVLSKYNVAWSTHNNCRIVSDDAMPLVRMAAFDVANRVMTRLAAEKISAVIGNWVRARGKGIIDGVDYGASGEVDKISKDAVVHILDDGFIPIFPCIGWNAMGKPYNISSISLATEIAMRFSADKLFFLTTNAMITPQEFTLKENIGLSPEGYVPAMNLEDVKDFLQDNSITFQADDKKAKTIELLSLASQACSQGVSRVHILNGLVDGIIPCEIFSGLGAGTMVYTNDYGGIRDMTLEDIPDVLSLMNPFVEQGILLSRTAVQLEEEYQDFIVYELDGGIRACAALHIYDNEQGEIAAVAVDKRYAHIGIGPKNLSYLLERARQKKLKSVFILTTRTADWFEQQGFVFDEIDTLPEKRRALWNPARKSRLLRLFL